MGDNKDKLATTNAANVAVNARQAGAPAQPPGLKPLTLDEILLELARIDTSGVDDAMAELAPAADPLIDVKLLSSSIGEMKTQSNKQIISKIQQMLAIKTTRAGSAGPSGSPFRAAKNLVVCLLLLFWKADVKTLSAAAKQIYDTAASRAKVIMQQSGGAIKASDSMNLDVSAFLQDKATTDNTRKNIVGLMYNEKRFLADMTFAIAVAKVLSANKAVAAQI